MILREIARRKMGDHHGHGATVTLFPETYPEDMVEGSADGSENADMMDDEGEFETDERAMAEYEEGIVWVGCGAPQMIHQSLPATAALCPGWRCMSSIQTCRPSAMPWRMRQTPFNIRCCSLAKGFPPGNQQLLQF
jgi:hypothetical protein